jgi:triosephosphate isomerase
LDLSSKMSSSRKRLIAGNWKMNTNRSTAIQLASHVVASSVGSDNANLLICVPSIHLADISKLVANSKVILGAQDAHWLESGAVTGEISMSMLSDYQVEYVLVGHSERRQMFADDNQRVALKFEAALKNGITPILCIGETLEQREQSITLDVLIEQIEAVVKQVGIEAFSKACVAYEPIWAIGTGKTASPEQAQQVHQALRAWFNEQNSSIATSLQILYGGSMNAGNAKELLAQTDIDGGLIGGASLKADDFLDIYSAAG